MDIDWEDSTIAISLLGRQVGLWRWEFASDRVQWSDHLLQMLGLERDQFVEHFDYFANTVLHPDDRTTLRAEVRRHIETGEAYRLRCRLRHAAGHYITTLAQGTSVRTPDGAPHEMIGTVIDVSGEVEVAAQLVESERTFRSLAENVPGAIFRYVLHPDGRDGIEYMSPGCLQIWEISAEQLEGDPTSLWDVIFGEDIAAMRASVRRSAETLGQWHHRWRIQTPSGKVKHLEGRGLPAQMEDGAILWDSVVLDVSEEVAVREELLRQQEMLGHSQRMEAMGRIAGGIAHDFNNLLAIVMGNAELVEDASGPSEQAAFLREIVAACERGGELTRRLLSFARRSPLSPEAIDVNAAMARLASMVARVIPENISVESRPVPGLWRAEADVALLESAMLNLCINARDAMPDGGTLTIATENLALTSDETVELRADMAPGDYVAISVTDTGVGIPVDQIALVTEPFYTTKGPDLGSGLGLAMVDGFVRQSNGAMQIDSTVGRGTTIRLFLPAARGIDEVRTEAVDTAVLPAVPARILIVEDEPSIRAMLERSLRMSGYQTASAPNGDAALAQFGDTAGEYDILLTDVVMPGALQGPALAARLAELNPRLQVIYISGHPSLPDDTNGVPQGEKFLMKPILRQTLLRAIADLQVMPTADG